MSTRTKDMDIIKGFVKDAHNRGDEASRKLYAKEWTRRATEAEKRRAPKFLTRGVK